MASSSLDTTDSNHTYEPIETAQAMLTADGPHNGFSTNNTSQQQQHPVTLIHHDGRRVTTNRIVSLESLREVLLEHEKVPYDDPECRGDLYILAPMRLLTPVIEESESDFTRSRLYQSLTQGSNYSGQNYQQAAYSDVDTSIMSIISEVLNVRSSAAAGHSGSSPQPRRQPSLASARAMPAPMLKEEVDGVDTSSLLHTIEEIRNSSLCNLYYSSTPSLQERPGRLPPVPLIPPRDTAGYASLCKENKESKAAAGTRHDIHSARGFVSAPSPTPAAQQLNESIRSVDSNTLVVTPPTVKRQRSRRKSPGSGKGGCRKNILDLVGGDGAANILNTPKSLKVTEKLVLADSNLLSDSLASESNEFRSLMPHLTNTGAKFLSRVVKAAGGTMGGGGTDAGSDLDASHNFPPPSSQPQQRRASVGADVSTFSAETPSPKQFVRHFSSNYNSNKNQKPLPPRRKFSLVRPRFDSSCSGGAESTSDDGENSDIKYGFMPPEHPDAKYGFGVFAGEISAVDDANSYNIVETAKLCNSSSFMRANFMLPPPAKASLAASTSTPKADSSSGCDFILPPSASVYSLSALNRADTAFKLNPEDKYEQLHPFSHVPRNSWQSASLQQRRPFGDNNKSDLGDSVSFLIGQRSDAGRRSMSILDDHIEEKENGRRPPPPPPCVLPAASQQPPKRRPLAVLNKTSPLKILGNNRRHSPQARVYRLNQVAASKVAAPAKTKLFGKRTES
jgi:hypothetical protein